MRIRDLAGDAGGVVAITNPNDDWIALPGPSADGLAIGAGVALKSHPTLANSFGGYTNLGTMVAACCALRLKFGPGEASTHRIVCELSKDGVSTFGVPFFLSSGNGRTMDIPLPLAMAAGQQVWMRIQGSAADTDISVVAYSLPASATRAPGFTDMVALTTIGASTRPSSTSVPLAATNTAYTPVVASSALDIGAMLITWGELATPTVSQHGAITLATGAATAEVPAAEPIYTYFSTSAPYVGAQFHFVRKPFPATTRFSVNIRSAVGVGIPDSFVFCLVGFRNP